MAAPLIETEISGELAGDWKVFTSSTIEVMLPTLESSALLLSRTISHWRSRERGTSGAAPVKRLTGAAAMPWASSSSRRRRYLSSEGMGQERQKVECRMQKPNRAALRRCFFLHSAFCLLHWL